MIKKPTVCDVGRVLVKKDRRHKKVKPHKKVSRKTKKSPKVK